MDLPNLSRSVHRRPVPYIEEMPVNTLRYVLLWMNSFLSQKPWKDGGRAVGKALETESVPGFSTSIIMDKLMGRHAKWYYNIPEFFI